MTVDRHRRALILAALATPFAGLRAVARDAPLLIDWPDLIPSTVDSLYSRLPSMGVLDHGTISVLPGAEEAFTAVTEEFNGKLIKMPGFIIPMEMGAEGVTTMLLVPFVGACIHVPPPPPNQLVYVTTPEPYADAGLFDPVWVTGILSTSPTSTELAEVGYTLAAELIEPYE